MNFKDRILLYELSLNDTDDQIINYIQLNKELVIKQSIQKTAEALYTVPNTIVRLSKKLGYASFSEMKFELKYELSQSHQDNQTLPKHLPQSVLKTCQLIDQSKVQRVADIICQAKEVLFLGLGENKPICEIFGNNLTCVDIPHSYCKHRHEMMYRSKHVTSKHVCIAISVRGESPDIIEAAKLAKENGATLITLTHFSKSTLTEIGDINLYFYGEYEELNGYNTTNFSGAIILIRFLCDAIFSRAAMKNSIKK